MTHVEEGSTLQDKLRAVEPNSTEFTVFCKKR